MIPLTTVDLDTLLHNQLVLLYIINREVFCYHWVHQGISIVIPRVDYQLKFNKYIIGEVVYYIIAYYIVLHYRDLYRLLFLLHTVLHYQ